MMGEAELVRDIGMLEILVIFAIVMLLYGGRKLPEMARSIARARKVFEEETDKPGGEEELKVQTEEEERGSGGEKGEGTPP